MNALISKIGLPLNFEFHDIYSLTDPSLLAFIPRPVHALLVILPLTTAWHASRVAEDKDKAKDGGYGTGDAEEWGGTIWFKQTIGHACGSIGALHCCLNGAARHHILPGSTLAQIHDAAIPLAMEERAKMLYDNQAFEEAHQSVAEMGDTAAPSAEDGDRLGQHFVAFVKGDDGRLWELEGSRKGPLLRGVLGESEDVLSERGLEMGLGRVIEMEKQSGGGDLRFSCIALTG